MYMYTDIIGIKTHWYGKQHQARSERTQLYVLLDANSKVVICRDYSQYIVTWFNKGSKIWK